MGTSDVLRFGLFMTHQLAPYVHHDRNPIIDIVKRPDQLSVIKN
jgi:hypothetical protein